jgi:hypothetical protein
MLRRDKHFYRQAFSNIGFELVDAAISEWDPSAKPWSGIVCLSLSDGDSTCLDKAQYPGLQDYQRVSRLPGLRKTLWNKDAFCYTLKTMTDSSPVVLSDFSFDCWVLPAQWDELTAWASSVDSKRAAVLSIGPPVAEVDVQQYIVKPFSAGEGLGIKLLQSAAELAEFKAKPIIVQPYMEDPLLINGYKFDIRNYVVVTSITPLRAYLYGEGLVRFASERYTKKSKKKKAFLTNTSVNKDGSKLSDITWSMAQLEQHAVEQQHDPAEVRLSYPAREPAASYHLSACAAAQVDAADDRAHAAGLGAGLCSSPEEDRAELRLLALLPAARGRHHLRPRLDAARNRGQR